MKRRRWWEILTLLPRFLLWFPLLIAVGLLCSIGAVLADRASWRARVEMETTLDGAYDRRRDSWEGPIMKWLGHVAALMGGAAFGAIVHGATGVFTGAFSWQTLLLGAAATGLSALVGYITPSPSQQAGK